MWARLTTLRKIYRDETRFDWSIFAVNTVCVILVLAASAHARSELSFPHEPLQVATSGF